MSTSPAPAACSKTCGHVHGVAERHARCFGTRAVARDRNLACVDADARGQSDAETALDVVVHRVERGLHLERGANRPDSIVFVRRWDTEQADDRIADELLDAAAVALDDRAHRDEVAGQQLGQRLRIDGLGHGGRVDEIGEQDSDGLALADRIHTRSVPPAGGSNRRLTRNDQPDLTRVDATLRRVACGSRLGRLRAAVHLFDMSDHE